MKLLRTGLLSLIISAMSLAAAGGVALSPVRLDLTLPPGAQQTEVVHLYTTGAADLPLSATVSDWTLSPSGTLSFLPMGSVEYSASSWVSLEASQTTVPGKGQTAFRLQLAVPRDASLAGTYHTVVFFATQPTAPQTTGLGIVTRQRIGLIIYVTIAGTQRNASSLQDFYRDGNKLWLVVDNSGNTLMRYSGTIEFRDREGATLKTVPISGGVVLRGSSETISVPTPAGLKSGFYVALALVKDDRGGVLAGQLPLQIK